MSFLLIWRMTHEQYTMIITHSKALYHVAREIRDTANEERMEKFLRAMYEVDECCGIDEELTPNLSNDEHNRILSLLDQDREKLKQTLLRNIVNFPEDTRAWDRSFIGNR
jgi:hypothetical protein